MVPIRTLSVSILEFILAIRLLVRYVTGFNKDCPHLLSARLRLNDLTLFDEKG
jgi:hypothetical protein